MITSDVPPTHLVLSEPFRRSARARDIRTPTPPPWARQAEVTTPASTPPPLARPGSFVALDQGRSKSHRKEGRPGCRSRTHSHHDRPAHKSRSRTPSVHTRSAFDTKFSSSTPHRQTRTPTVTFASSCSQGADAAVSPLSAKSRTPKLPRWNSRDAAHLIQHGCGNFARFRVDEAKSAAADKSPLRSLVPSMYVPVHGAALPDIPGSSHSPAQDKLSSIQMRQTSPLLGDANTDTPEERHQFLSVSERRLSRSVDDGSDGERRTSAQLEEGRKRLACFSKGPLKVFKDQPFLASLLGFIPFGVASHLLDWGDATTFSLNFMAIVPQAWLMGKCTEDLSFHMGQIAGGLLNAWFGNVVEMLLCIAGLRAGELRVVKATLVGSILSNLLLVAGCSFLFGGIKHKVQEFSAIGASTNASLMTLSCLCLGLPTMYGTLNPSGVDSELNISRSVSVLLIIMYIQYLIFQLWSHSFLFENDDDDEDGADLSVAWSAFILASCTICCSVNSEFLIHSVKGTVDSWNVSKSFIGIILLPIIGNAAEHYTSVIVAMRNKMDLSLACAVGSSCQMALFVTPFTVLVGWALHQPMSLDLHAFEMTVLLLAVLIVTSILQDGYSNWLEGSMLCSAYFVVALIYFFEDPSS